MTTWTDEIGGNPFEATVGGPEASHIPLSPLPYGSAIEIWLATPERRLFHITRGRHGFQGAFAALWLTVVLCMTVSIVNQPRKAGDDPVVAAAAMAAFWLAGFAMLFAGVRHRHLKTTVLLERDRLVVARNLFGWESVDETSLAGASAADLVVAYEENYKPVFAVRVQGGERKIQFGAALETFDKNWLVDEINGFLHRTL